MNELNKIITDLWHSTYKVDSFFKWPVQARFDVYQGDDIDTIQIRANSESNKRCSYNYRVDSLPLKISLW